VWRKRMCVINIRRGINIAHLFMRNNLLVQHRRQWQQVHEKCVTFSTTDWGWKIYITMTCSFHTKCTWVSHCQIVKQQGLMVLQGSVEHYWKTVQVSWMSRSSSMKHCHLDGYINKQHCTESLNKFVNSFVPCLH
jgi:hypothetical protein